MFARSVTRVLALHLAALAAVPVIAVPILGLLPSIQKGLFVGLAQGLLWAFVGVAVLVRAHPGLTFPRPGYFLASIALLASAGIPLVWSDVSAGSLWGLSSEIGTLGSVALFVSVVMAASLAPRSVATIVPRIFIVSVSIAATLSIGLFAFAPGFFPGESLSGPWPQLSFLIAAALLMCAVAWDYAERTSWLYPVLAAPLVAGFLFFSLSAAAILLAVASLAGIALSDWRVDSRRQKPFFLACVAVFAIGILFPSARDLLPTLQPVIRPSIQASMNVITPLYLESPTIALFGKGSGELSAAWERQRTLEYNASYFWDHPVTEAYSTAFTLAIAFGALGLLSFVLIPFFLMLDVRRVFTGVEHRASRELLMLSLFLLATHLFYSSGSTSFFLAAATLGAYAVLRGESPIRTSPPTFFLRMSVAVLCIVVSILFTWVTLKQARAALHFTRGTALERIDDALSSTEFHTAARTWGTTAYRLEASRVFLGDALRMLATATGNRDILQKVQQDMITAASFSDEAVAASPKNFTAWRHRAELYTLLSLKGFPDAAKVAQEAYAQASILSPLHPSIPFLRAQNSYAEGNIDEAERWLGETLWRKPDFQPARDLTQEWSGAR